MIRDQKPLEEPDLLLLSFLQMQEAAKAELLLINLLSNYAEPLIRNITRSKLRSALTSPTNGATQDCEDVHGEAVLRILARLRALRASPGDARIGDFRGYVAAVTHNCYHKYLRQKYPERCRLKNRLRYALNHHVSLALWEDERGNWLCGLASWKPFDSFTKGHPQHLPCDLKGLNRLALTGQDAGTMNAADLLSRLFAWLQYPLALDELVSIVAELWGIKDQLQVTGSPESEPGEFCETLPDGRIDTASQVERRLYLERLWSEICQLPPRQRVALLLNLRDASGRDVLSLFPLTGVATLGSIAAVLDLPMDEFAELWKELPLDDLSIARRMGITRQQVINLRKSARERLARRMQAWEEGHADKSAFVNISS